MSEPGYQGTAAAKSTGGWRLEIERVCCGTRV
jgi:hypothetical protein